MVKPNATLNLDNSILSEIPDIRSPYLAECMCERIIDKIEKFEEKLPNDMQASCILANFANKTFAIDNIGYHNPDMIIFYGTQSDGSQIELLQHTSQLNLLLVGVKRSNPQKPRHKIGFVSSEE